MNGHKCEIKYYLRRGCFYGLCYLFFALLVSHPLRASEIISLYEGSSASVLLPIGARIVHVGSNEVATAMVKGKYAIISGKRVGVTNVLLLSSDGSTLQERDVRVGSRSAEIDSIASRIVGEDSSIRTYTSDDIHTYSIAVSNRESANRLAQARLLYTQDDLVPKLEISVSDDSNIHLRVAIVEVDSNKLVNSVRKKFRFDLKARLFVTLIENPVVGISHLAANMEWGAVRKLPGVKSVKDVELVFRNGESATMQMRFSGANIERNNVRAERELILKVFGEKNNSNSYNLHIMLNHNDLSTSEAQATQDRSNSVFESHLTIPRMQSTLVARVRSRDVFFGDGDSGDNDNDVLLLVTALDTGSQGAIDSGDKLKISRQLAFKAVDNVSSVSGGQYIIFP